MALPRFADIPWFSTEYVRVRVKAFDRGRRVDPRAMGVQFAWTLTNSQPTMADWVSGEWEAANGTFFGRCLVGPEGVKQLTPGDWVTWIRIITNPEQPSRAVGILRVS